MLGRLRIFHSVPTWFCMKRTCNIKIWRNWRLYFYGFQRLIFNRKRNVMPCSAHPWYSHAVHSHALHVHVVHAHGGESRAEHSYAMHVHIRHAHVMYAYMNTHAIYAGHERPSHACPRHAHPRHARPRCARPRHEQCVCVYELINSNPIQLRIVVWKNQFSMDYHRSANSVSRVFASHYKFIVANQMPLLIQQQNTNYFTKKFLFFPLLYLAAYFCAHHNMVIGILTGDHHPTGMSSSTSSRSDFMFRDFSTNNQMTKVHICTFKD